MAGNCSSDEDTVVRRDIERGAPWVFRGRLPGQLTGSGGKAPYPAGRCPGGIHPSGAVGPRFAASSDSAASGAGSPGGDETSDRTRPR
ncbi:hypothetical protein GCM10023328_40040 [Modestobacter marinus]|uniref:Uncharacterized protein n=1 Tax=Modestobacter marinus TaxID=477641 RepID=A0ABQ2FVR5_9ACTN|nr:hypothetical protein GCM10011589_14150 [Modestobacter marinus]